MRNTLTVIDTFLDNNTGRPKTFIITGIFPTVSAIKSAIFTRRGIECRQQLLLHGDRLMFGERDYSTRFDLLAMPAITLYRRLPDDQLLTINVRHLQRGRLSCSFQADLPVPELKEFLARKYCMAPWKQVLMTLKAPMLSSDMLGDYATSTHMEVSLSEYFDGREPTPLRIKVIDDDTKKEKTFVVEKRDTMDVLLGHLETSGMVGKDEKASFSHDNAPLDNWSSFEACEVTDNATLLMFRNHEDE